jgi:hypothetical protein
MRDFTLKAYKALLEAIKQQGFSFYTFQEFVSNHNHKSVVLRHDVDSKPDNSLKFARIQTDKGIKGTFFFRIVPGSFDERIIKEIHSLGHEVGYHYEDVSLTAERQKIKGKRQKWDSQEDYEKYLAGIAIESFKENLEKLRKIVPVNTICMHGSPMSRWDSRLLWKYYDYHDFGIVGEPYFDVNFDEVLYLTDTGRRWDGDAVSIRDKATGDGRLATGEEKKGRGGEVEKRRSEYSVSSSDHLKDEFTLPPTACSLQPYSPFPRFHSTFDIIKAAENNQLPDKIMLTFHPQRWTDKPMPWVRELVWQNVKNVGKYILIKLRN